MKPIRLTMSAFGSYAGEASVDFSKMDHGIFLVSGDTGSGKTTIFDAIVYALYDRTSGGIRDGNMMRSAYADLRTPTFVELAFLCRGEAYRIVRNPDYERESLRRDKNGIPKKTQEKSKAELYLPDGSVFRGNKREINQKIEALLGMDARQFMQMAMIAQGDFLKLLHAKSEERKEIFSKIFDTAIYGKIQEELKRQEKESYVRLKEKEQACQEQISRILYPEDWEQAEERKACKTANRLHEVLLLLEALIEADQTRECLLSEKKAKISQQSADMNKMLELLEGIVSIRDRRAQQEAWLKEHLPKEAEYAQRERQAEQLLKVKEEEYLLFVQNLQKELEAFQEKQDVLENRLKDMEGLKRLWEQAIQSHKKQKGDAVKWDQANGAYHEKQKFYEAVYEAFFQEQAGILAQNLKRGEPCPVCGSREHPHRAKVSQHAPDQSRVKEAKQAVQKAEEERERLQENYQKSAQAYQAALGSLNQEGKRLLGSAFDAGGQEWREKANEAMETARADMELCRKSYQGKKQQGIKQTEKLKAELMKYKKYRQEARDAREDFIRQAERLKGEEAASGLQEQELLRELKECSGEDWDLSSESPLTHAEKSKAQAVLLQKEKEILEHAYQECHVRSRTNQGTREVLLGYQEDYEKLTEHFTLVRHLSQTAGGSLTGSARVDFESYIQRQYFEKIIQRANQRLMQMSSGQFLLKCRAMEQMGSRGKAGLDLDVYSLVTESSRDVKTLSGGESFMAALSMALGLADVVQDSAGAIRLETMFIDEGFGSLDDNAREQAIRVLYGLAGEQRLIGIISHVTELKEQIESKLIVTKGKKGSRVSWLQEG